MDIDNLVKEKKIKHLILALDDDNSESADKAAEALRKFQKEDWNACKEVVEEMQKDPQNDGNAMSIFADLLFELGKELSYIGGEEDVDIRKQEIAAYDKTLSVKPAHTPCLNNKAITLMQIKHWEEAADCFDKVIKADPMYIEAWRNKAISYWNGKKFEEAIEAATEATVHDPSQKSLLDYMTKNVPFHVVHLK